MPRSAMPGDASLIEDASDASSDASDAASTPDGASDASAQDAGVDASEEAGTVTQFLVPTASCNPYWITAGPNGALWFTETAGNNIGRLTSGGEVLPSIRFRL